MITDRERLKQVHALTADRVAPALADAVQAAAADLVNAGFFTDAQDAAQALIVSTASLLIKAEVFIDEGEPMPITPRQLSRPSWRRAWFKSRFPFIAFYAGV